MPTEWPLQLRSDYACCDKPDGCTQDNWRLHYHPHYSYGVCVRCGMLVYGDDHGWNALQPADVMHLVRFHPGILDEMRERQRDVWSAMLAICIRPRIVIRISM